MEIIVPAAGLSKRFPNMRPKYTLTDHNGNIMLKSAIEPFLDKFPITIGILKIHNNIYGVKDLLEHEFGNSVNIIVLDERTSGPAETVYNIIKKRNIDNDTEIFIKDCDSFFSHEYMPGNYVCVSTFTNNPIVKNPATKSYIASNNNGVIQNIVEKQVISDKFCVGGYKFESSKKFTSVFENLSTNNEEIYISNIIKYCLFQNDIFLENIVNNYVDVGTAEEWFEYNDVAVIFCDIDGTLIEAQGKNEYSKQAIPLNNNVSFIKERINRGDEIIFTTSRPEKERQATEKMLNKLGFDCFKLLMGLKNCKRILINDYNEANPYPRAIAVNIKRNQDNIKDYLK